MEGYHKKLIDSAIGVAADDSLGIKDIWLVVSAAQTLAKEVQRRHGIWVSTDTPPEGNDRLYLVTEPPSCGYRGRIHIAHWWNGQWGINNKPTHWMELPKHPVEHDIPDDESGEAYAQWLEKIRAK
jgi:hypothetical protein